MYRAFNIKLTDSDFEELKDFDYSDYAKEKSDYKLELKKLINSNKVIKAEEIKDVLMPNIKADIFISHSHKDEELAIKLAGCLKEFFGITSFIDSMYWGNIDELLEEMDACHYNSKKETYSHQKSQRSCRHADMILTSALTEMIDKCECVFFLNTDNSLPESKNILNAGTNSTYSPWIYHEIYTTTKLVKKKSQRQLNFSANESLQESYQEKIIKYELDLSGMKKLKFEDLCNWCSNKNGTNVFKNLDKLYELYPEKR